MLPIFPLGDVVFFPGTPLPLHVFEPRYRSLVETAMSGERLVGMIRFEPGWEAEYEGAPAIRAVGCAGSIDELSPLPDGRYNMVLRGAFRFRVVEEVESAAPFRMVRAERVLEPPEGSPGPAPELVIGMKRELLRLFGSFWQEIRGEELDVVGLGAGLSLAQLSDVLSYALPLDPDEKQALLETFDPFERGFRLNRHLEELLGETAGGDHVH